MSRSDEYLLELALQGDAACFGELIERWRQKIFRFICRYVGSEEDARDLTQDTFTQAFRNLDRLADPSRFSSWLYTIALNECRMRFRRRRPRVVDWQEHESRFQAALAGSAEDPEAALAARERVGILRQAFERLPEEQREVILMKEYQGMKFQEIADILDLPLSTVKSRMYLGLKTLRKLMEKRL